jgi:hypothetical protein
VELRPFGQRDQVSTLLGVDEDHAFAGGQLAAHSSISSFGAKSMPP